MLFWLLLGSAISGGFMHHFGADSLFLAPEYMGKVNFISAFFTGAAFAVFLMSWNVTTFILFSAHFHFLAATSRPFLRYCLNNSLIPLFFLINYAVHLVRFDKFRELMTPVQILLIGMGFVVGLLWVLLFSFAYFFGTEKAIRRSMSAMADNAATAGNPHVARATPLIKVKYYFGSLFSIHQTRDTAHYKSSFLETIFNRHHFAGVVGILLAFLLLILYGLFLDHPRFILPAASSIFLFFAILIAAVGALGYWLQSWGIPVMAGLLLIIHFLFQYDIIDVRNKAFGLDYENRRERPAYNASTVAQLCTPEKIAADSARMIAVLERWKQRQPVSRPHLVLLNFSGGGSRSAYFAVNMLQRIDSALGGSLMRQSFLITGASGGMLGATYYRELYRRQQQGVSIRLQDPVHAANIAKDLLNAIFSAYLTRDLLSPVQQFKVGEFRYVKDRGYAFEAQLLLNTGNILNGRLQDYVHEEQEARIPLAVFNATITQDGRKLMISTQPLSFLMRNRSNEQVGITNMPDAIDFAALFHRQQPMNLRLLTALRMNATFPFVLPNVWLPTRPVIDVMDAGLRDNYGMETSLRFLHVFENWIRENTAGVILIQLRDRKRAEWNEEINPPGLPDILYKPLTILQYNFYRMQDYAQESQLSFAAPKFSFPVRRYTFLYEPAKDKQRAALNFHLTEAEKQDIRSAVFNGYNQAALAQLVQQLQRRKE